MLTIFVVQNCSRKLVCISCRRSGVLPDALVQSDDMEPGAENVFLLRETLIYSYPFGLSLSKPLILKGAPFDRLRANGLNQWFLRVYVFDESTVPPPSE